jgi:hypothetical protein
MNSKNYLQAMGYEDPEGFEGSAAITVSDIPQLVGRDIGGYELLSQLSMSILDTMVKLPDL